MGKNNATKIQIAHKLLLEGNLKQATTICEQIISVSPANAEAYYLLGIIGEMNGKYEFAIQMLNKAIKIQPGTAKYHYSLGIAFIRTGNLNDAKTAFLKAVDLNPSLAEAYNNLGDVLVKMGRFSEASEYFYKALKIKPEMAAMIYLNLGNLHHKNNEPQKADSFYKKALSLKPDYAQAYYNLGALYQENHELKKAIYYYNKVLESSPENPEVFNALGALYHEKNESERAVTCYNKALTLKPDYAEAHFNLGHLHQDNKEPGKAIACYQKALSLKPDYAEVYNRLGLLAQDKLELDKAVSYYKKAISLKPEFAGAYYHFARITNQYFTESYFSPNHEDLGKVNKLFELPNLPARDRILLHFCLGEMYDNCALYDAAFEHYQKGNQLNRKQISINPSKFTDYIGQLQNTFKRGFWDNYKNDLSCNPTPIFIVGLSRSGKTLTERLISYHDSILGAGEINAINKFISAKLSKPIDTPEKFLPLVNHFKNYPLAETAKQFEKFLHGLSEGTTYNFIVDTMPANYQLLGMVPLIAPKAKIIYCRRNPLDNCLGIYFKYYTRGHNYAYDLEDIAFYYAQYLRLMEYWKSILPITIHEVYYEDLVENPKKTIKKIMTYLDLDWDRSCETSFAEYLVEKKNSATNQDMTPNHRRGIGWSSNYNKFLGPLQESLFQFGVELATD